MPPRIVLVGRNLAPRAAAPSRVGEPRAVVSDSHCFGCRTREAGSQVAVGTRGSRSGGCNRRRLDRPALARQPSAADPRLPYRIGAAGRDRKSTRLNSSHQIISYAVFCLKKKKIKFKMSATYSVICRTRAQDSIALLID